MKYLFYLVATMMLISCVDDFDAVLPQEKSNLLVVDGTIRSNMCNDFFLSRSLKLREDSTELNESSYIDAVIGAKLTIMGSDGSEYPLKSYGRYLNDHLREIKGPGYVDRDFPENGEYMADILELKPDVKYYLRIDDHGDIYETTPARPVVTPEIKSVDYLQSGKNEDVDILITTEMAADTTQAVYYQWAVDETWEVTPRKYVFAYYDYEDTKGVYTRNPFPKRGWKNGNLSGTKLLAETTNYDHHQLKKYKMYGIKCDDERVGDYYSGFLTQRALSKEEYEYQLAYQQASAEMGGLFSPQASTLPTNIHCKNGDKKALGFVGVSMNSCYTRYYVDGTKITRPKVLDPYILDERTHPEYSRDRLYLSDYRVYIRDGADPFDCSCSWVERKYVDISIQKGVYFNKPDYMR